MKSYKLLLSLQLALSITAFGITTFIVSQNLKDREYKAGIRNLIYSVVCKDGEGSYTAASSLIELKKKDPITYYEILITESLKGQEDYKGTVVEGCMRNVLYTYFKPSLYNAVEISLESY